MENEPFKNAKKFTAVLIIFAILSISLSPIFAEKADAQWIDISTAAKDYGLDALAWMIVNKIIERMTASTVNWINSGFNGSPAFVTNPDTYFQNIGDQLAGDFIFNNPDLNFLCSPIQLKIRLALTNAYIQQPNYQCTLTKVGQDMDSFMNNFQNGGWDSFFQLTQVQQNSPIGAFLMAQNQLTTQIGNKQTNLTNELNQGGGFLSSKQCKPGTQIASGGAQECADSYNSCLKVDKTPGDCSSAEAKCEQTIGNVQAGDCKDSDKQTVTPGSVISSQLNKSLGLGSDKLVTADEINELVSALLNQMVSQVMGGVGGLLGGSQPSSSGSASLASQLSSNSASTQVVDYFGNTQNISNGLSTTTTATTTTATTTATSVRPLDKDCANISDAELTLIAKNLRDNAALLQSNSSLNPGFSSDGVFAGEDISQVILNMDCPPDGIH